MKKNLVFILMSIFPIFAQMRYGVGIGYSPSVNSSFNHAIGSQGFMGYLESGYIFNERYEPGLRFASSYLVHSSHSLATVDFNHQGTIALFHGQFLNFSVMPYFRYFIIHEKLLAKELKPYALAGVGLSLDYALLGTPENNSHLFNNDKSLQAAKYRGVDVGARLAAGVRLKDFWDFSLGYHYGGTVNQKANLSPNNISPNVKNKYSAHLMELTVGISLGKKKKKELAPEELESPMVEKENGNIDTENSEKIQNLETQNILSGIFKEKTGEVKNDFVYQDFNTTKDSVTAILNDNERLFFLSTLDRKSFDKVDAKVEVYSKKDSATSDKMAEVLEQFSTKSGEKYVKIDIRNEIFAIVTTSEGQQYVSSLQNIKGDDIVIFVNDPSQPDLALTENEVLNLTDYTPKTTKQNHFGFDRYDLSDHEKQELDELIKLLKTDKNLMIVLEGHTDAFGSDDYNNELSRKRVVTVLLYLRRQGISKQQILFSFFGKYRLISKDPRLNRRVEARVVYYQP